MSYKNRTTNKRYSLGLYIKTIRYLKPSQIFYNIANRIISKRRFQEAKDFKRRNLSTKTNFIKVKNCLKDGSFVFLNKENTLNFPSDWNNSQLGKLWLYNLHYFDYLRQENISKEVGEKLISRWIAENPVGKGNGWEPYTISLRIVNWIKWHLSGNHLNTEALQSLANQTKFLEQKIERHLLANHYLANAKAFVFAGLFLEGEDATRWLKIGTDIYKEELEEQILQDGGHFERSAMYHSIILEDLLDLANIGAEIVGLNQKIQKMLEWLVAMTTPDGKIPLLNDCAHGIAPSPNQIFSYAKNLGFNFSEDNTQSVDLSDTGYAKLVAGDWTVICDCANLAPDYQPGHAHADTLTFELWHKDFKLITDSGTGEYIDTPLRKYQRSTLAHNTIQIDGKNSSEVWSAHRVANRAKIVERKFSGKKVSATHNGYGKILHKRTWNISDDGLSIDDEIKGNGRHLVEVLLHVLGENISINKQINRIEIVANGTRYFIAYPQGWDVEIQKVKYSAEFGIAEDIDMIKLSNIVELPINLSSQVGLLK